jgi:hypothetical protein
MLMKFVSTLNNADSSLLGGVPVLKVEQLTRSAAQTAMSERAMSLGFMSPV